MPGKTLKNKPLIEAILEVKWALTSPIAGVQTDPHYKILLGRLYDKVREDYPEHEQLPTASMPDEIAGGMVQHRFRHAVNDWPLLQVGPGIFTLNDTHKYTWPDFRCRAIKAITKLFEAYPKPDTLKVINLLLRYIDAVEFDYMKEDIFLFLKDKMKVIALLPNNLFTDNEIQNIPKHFNWQSTFVCRHPPGTVTVRFATGQKEGKPCLLWETMVQSDGSEVPQMPRDFEQWIVSAHNITDDWFFKIIEGELERRFNGE